MRKLRAILALILAAMLLMSVIAISTAEVQKPSEDWQADIRVLMDETHVPKGAAVGYDFDFAEDTQTVRHSVAIDKVNTEDVTMRVEIGLISTSEMSDEDWETIEAWANSVVSAAIMGVVVEPEAMAEAVDKAIRDARKSAVPDADGSVPMWAADTLMVEEIDVTIPFYPELSEGVNGTATQKLQQKLIELGFLNDKADGYFGGKTQTAVEALQEYVRELEQDAIDALPTVEPTPTPVPMPVPSPEASSEASLEQADAETPQPTEEPEPTPTPVPDPTPVTEVDGVADALLLAYLYSDDFKPVRGELRSGDNGADVKRVQRRLAQMGYMTDAADGIYGEGTARSVEYFQYYNELEMTGVADVATQQLLFSSNAKVPENAMLSEGSSGDAVRKLQLRLRVLGFTKASVDGDYGSSTRKAVETLQKYMRELEEAQIRADAETMTRLETTGEDISALLTVEVNGIADPILLDAFYSADFPAIPDAMERGDSGIDVVRVQRRLNALEYYYSGLDGEFGGGTSDALDAFQKRNGLERTGVADEATLKLLFSEDALKALKPYVLKISIDDQRVYAYGLDANNEYTELVRTMKCSTGKDETPTPKGTFQSGTGPGARWHYFTKYECWAQYAYYIDGAIMFHSVLYNEKEGQATQSSINNLGRKASHGCVRLSVEDAKWIWNNCPRNTKIIVY